MMGVHVRDKKSFVKIFLVGRNKRKVVERGVEERKLKRTAGHASDLGHVPFREV